MGLSLVVSGPYSFSKNSLGLEGFLWTSLVKGGAEMSAWKEEDIGMFDWGDIWECVEGVI